VTEIKILLIEDNMGHAKLVEVYLSAAANFEVSINHATTLKECLKELSQNQFDVVLLDLGLPDSSGLNTLKEVLKKHKDQSIVLLTSDIDKNLGLRAVKLGAQDFLQKEKLTIESLSRAIEYALQRGIMLKRIKRYEIIFNETNEAIYVSKFDGDIEVCNKAFCDLLGYKMDEVLHDDKFSKKCYKNLNDRKKLQAEIEKKGRVKDFAVKLLNKKGDVIECSIAANIWKENNGKAIGYFGTIRDMTEHNRLAARDAQLKIAEVTAKLKNEFLANMTHEIRTPMNVVVGMTELLKNTNLEEEQLEYVTSMKASSENLMKIINAILDFSKIESGKMELEEKTFNLPGLIEELFQTFKHETKPGVSLYKQLDANLPETIIGDRLRLNQVLLNLLSNALKYTFEGEITLKVSLLEKSDDKVNIKFSVQDSGIGIPEDKQTTVFQMFTQASQETTRLYGGTGLGLTISKQIVELMNGRISVESEAGKGSNFIFNAEFKRLDAQPKLQNEKEGKRSKIISKKAEFDTSASIRLLLVEDHEMNQIVATKILENEYSNISIDIAENGQIAFDKVSQNDYHLVLMDINMPVLNGIDATKKIRTKLKAPKNKIPILGLSAHAFSAEVENCINAGMHDFISKPINVQDLKEKINEVILQKVDVAQVNNKQTQKPKLNGSAAATISKKNKNNKSKNGVKHQKLINLKNLKQLANGDENNFNFYINTIGDACPKDLKQLKDATDIEDWDMVSKTAHKLKSTIGYLGIELLKPVIKEVENNAARRIALGKIPKQVEDVTKYCNLALHELQAYT